MKPDLRTARHCHAGASLARKGEMPFEGPIGKHVEGGVG